MIGHEAEEQRVRGARSSAHIKSYEAAFTSIYWRELGSVRARQAVRTSGQEKTAAARSPHDMAMRLARLQVGAPVPRMEQQYWIEALLETIKIRSRLATLARTFGERAGQMVASQLSDRHRKAFDVARASFEHLAKEILRSSTADLSLARELSEECEAWRLALIGGLLSFQASFDTCRVEMGTAARPLDGHSRQSVLVPRAEAQLKKSWNDFESGVQGVESRAGAARIKDMIGESIMPAAMIIEREWQEYLVALKGAETYNPVSLEEKLQIMKAVLETHWGKRLECGYLRLADVRCGRKVLPGPSCISRTPALH